MNTDTDQIQDQTSGTEVKDIVKGISARQQGDTYQERAFWFYVCRLFRRHTKGAKQVGYEITDVPYFDDVVCRLFRVNSGCARRVSLSRLLPVQMACPIKQGSLTCEAMIEPSFIELHSEPLSSSDSTKPSRQLQLEVSVGDSTS